MKQKGKAIASSIVSIALSASLAVGGTFALFTSESEVNIAVTSGTVSLIANIDEDSVQTKQLYDTAYTQGVDNMFEGEATFGTEGLTLEKFVPGDGIKFNIVVKNESTVSVKYRTIISCKNDNGLFAGLKVDIDNLANYNGEEYVAKWESKEVGAQDIIVPVIIELPEDANNEYQDKTCTISYKVEAVQGNAKTYNNVKATTTEELTNALADASEGDLIDATDVTLDVNTIGTDIPNGKRAVNIPGDITIQNLTITGSYRGGNTLYFQGTADQEIVFENCAFTLTGRSLGFDFLCAEDGVNSVVYNGCSFDGAVVLEFLNSHNGVATYNNCTFTKSSFGNSYVMANGGTHLFNGCTFDYTGLTQSNIGVINTASINSVSESDGSNPTVVILDGCTRINCGTRKYGSNSTLTVK